MNTEAIAIGYMATTIEHGCISIGEKPTNAIAIGAGTVAEDNQIVIGTEEHTSVQIAGIDLFKLLDRIDVLECHVNALLEASTLPD